MYRTMLAATLTLMLVAVGFAVAVPTAYAQEPCGGPKDPCPPPPACDPKTEKCGICHNIGGPQELGANCDGSGFCTYALSEGGAAITIPEDNFLGIIISFNQDSAGALEAHLRHGDGEIVAVFTPALHLASEGQNHNAANVECQGIRRDPQPPEPGN